MLSFEKFAEYIAAIEASNKKVDEIYSALGGGEEIFKCTCCDTAIELLSSLMEDSANEWIDYWMYEQDFGRKWTTNTASYADGTPIMCRNVRELYDFLASESKSEAVFPCDSKTRKRKYLDDIGVTDRPDTWNKGDKRQKKWAEQRTTYGFDERETWALNSAFYLWLYERLKMYMDTAGKVIDLNYHKFEFKGKEYTQRELINMMLERLEFWFKPGYNDMDDEQYTKVHEIGEIWALVLPAMWW